MVGSAAIHRRQLDIIKALLCHIAYIPCHHPVEEGERREEEVGSQEACPTQTILQAQVQMPEGSVGMELQLY